MAQRKKVSMPVFNLKVEFATGRKWDLQIAAPDAENALTFVPRNADILSVSLYKTGAQSLENENTAAHEIGGTDNA